MESGPPRRTFGGSYQAVLDYLYPRTTVIKLGLDGISQLLGELGDPHRIYPVIHVGGTNGKGSVVTLIAAALRAAGLRVGVYTSPHLVSFRERITVDGVPISREAVIAWTEEMLPVAERNQATFFELTTAMAFADFAARGIDIAVVEVGLGGELDSTNIVEPLVSVVTHVALDHREYLGDSIEAIARAKAGIAKPGVPFVIGEEEPVKAELLLLCGRAAAATDYCPVVVPPGERWNGPLGLAGSHQRRNAAVANTVLGLLPRHLRPGAGAIAAGFAEARLPGRFDLQGKWLYDVAHNPDGMATLVAAIREGDLPRPIHAVISILGDKDWQAMLELLEPVVDIGYLTAAPTAGSRVWDSSAVAAWIDGRGRTAPWRWAPDFGAALRQAKSGAGTVLVTGSFHTVGDAMARGG